MRRQKAGQPRSARGRHPCSWGCRHDATRTATERPPRHPRSANPALKSRTMQSTHRALLAVLILLSVAHHPRCSRAPPARSWNLDYEARLRRAGARGRAPGPRSVHVRWLHVPKTGTSFANTLVRWGCPSAEHPFITPRRERPAGLVHPLRATHSWDWLFLNDTGRSWLRHHCTPRLAHIHRGRVRYAFNMHRALDKREIRHAVGFFRIPLQRVYSNYLHLSHHYNESTAPRETLTSFVSRTQFWSQQAKLLLGRHYRDPRVVTEPEARYAAQTLRSMLFVGLTEHFQLSCRLFHAMFGGVPHRAQFENVRPGIRRYRHRVLRQAQFRYDELAFEGWRDHADDVVYHAACERFWADVRRYKAEIEKDGLGNVIIPPEEPTTRLTAPPSSPLGNRQFLSLKPRRPRIPATIRYLNLSSS